MLFWLFFRFDDDEADGEWVEGMAVVGPKVNNLPDSFL